MGQRHYTASQKPNELRVTGRRYDLTIIDSRIYKRRLNFTAPPKTGQITNHPEAGMLMHTCATRQTHYTPLMPDVAFSFAGHAFVPLASGALFWPAFEALLVADLHLEKASYYGIHGQFLPPYDSLDTLDLLAAEVAATGAARVWCLGDSFHDSGGVGRLPDAARVTIAGLIAEVDWLWITGNHDGDSAAALGGRVADEARVGGVALRHAAVQGAGGPEISGHYHPKVAVSVRGRRIVRRCFAVTPQRIVLPAFGALTGGLHIDDPAFIAAIGGPLLALVPTRERLLRFPVAA